MRNLSLGYYNKQEEIFDTSKAIMICIFFSILINGVVQLSYSFIWHSNINYLMPSILILMLFLPFIHEILHILPFFNLSKIFDNDYDFQLSFKSFIPHTHFTKLIKINRYRLSLVLPSIILGFIPIFLGFLFNNMTITAIGSLMLIGGIADFLILFRIRKYPKNSLIQDHISKLGCVVYST